MMLWQFLCINFGYKTKLEVEAAANHYNSAMILVNGRYVKNVEWMLVPGDEVSETKRFE